MESLKHSAKWLSIGAAVAALTLAPIAAPAALASGGVNSGGVNSGGVNSGGGTGGGGTGGGGTGGGGTTTPTSCTSISSLSNAVGYYSVYAAVWSSFSLSSSCSGNSSGTWQLTYRNDNTGAIEFSSSGTYRGGAGFGTMIDDDFAPFSTSYTVTLTVTDPKGMQSSRSAPAITPAPKVGP